jgi:hypothetical protein
VKQETHDGLAPSFVRSAAWSRERTSVGNATAWQPHRISMDFFV